MRIAQSQIQFDAAAKTAVLSDRTQARQMLQQIAADLVTSTGKVKGGFLHLSAGGAGVQLRAGHFGGGATAATRWIRTMVADAYGPEASAALDTYLRNGPRALKIGSQSFVKLVQAMEARDTPPELQSGLERKLGAAWRASLGRLQTESLTPLARPWRARFEAASTPQQVDALRAQAIDHGRRALAFVQGLSAEDLSRVNRDVGIVYDAVFADPSIMDPAKSREERAQMLRPHQDAFLEEARRMMLKSFEPLYGVELTDRSQLAPDDQVTFDLSLVSKSQSIDEAQTAIDLDLLEDPASRALIHKVLVDGKWAGMPLEALKLLPRGVHHVAIVAMNQADLEALVTRLFSNTPLSEDDLLRVDGLFGPMVDHRVVRE